MKTSLAERLSGYGKWTYRGAWLLEIVAAAIGLATGLALGYQAFSSSESTTSMDLILAGAPFFMVALAELTKIPAATLLFSVAWPWKPVTLIFMLLLAGITFETVFMGLERAATLRQLKYETLRQEIDGLRQEATNLSASMQLAANQDFVADAQRELNDIVAGASAERGSFEEQLSAVDKEIEGRVSLSPEAARLRDQLTEAKTERAELLATQSAELDNAIQQFERQRDSFVERIRIYTESGDSESVRREQEQLTRLANPRPSIEKRHSEALKPLEDRIRQLQAQFDELLATSAPMTEEQRARLEDRRRLLVERMDSAMELWNERTEAAKDRLASAQRMEANEAAVAGNNQQRIDEISKAVSQREAQRIPMAREDQIRRIAGRVFGVKAEDVTEGQAELIAMIWFGSLAGLAALAGPLTAIVALALQKIASKQIDTRSAESPLARLVRLLLTRWRWKRVRTVTVTVPIEVIKEVEKPVPVEVEKLVKEILYVPVLTDDPDVVLQAMKSSLPPEASEQIQQATKRGRRASKAQHVPT